VKKTKLTKAPKDVLLEYVTAVSLGEHTESRVDVGWSNSSPEHIMWWLGAGRKRLISGEEAKNRGRYVTAPWWCLPAQRKKCRKAGKCLKGNCLGTRKEKYRKCHKIRLFQAWGFYKP